MLEFYDRTVSLFATQILQQKTSKMRASVIIHLFLVCTSKIDIAEFSCKVENKNLIYIFKITHRKFKKLDMTSIY